MSGEEITLTWDLSKTQHCIANKLYLLCFIQC